MNILSLHLKNFRNYDDLKIDLDARLVFIIGPNANGKTNIIEAISILSIGKSFRGISDTNIIKDKKTFYNISCDFEKYNKINFISIGSSVENKHVVRKIKFNNKNIQSRQKLVGQLVTIIMSPNDLNIIEGGPANRRRFIDLVLSYEDATYFQDLLQFNRILKQRNILLKQIKHKKTSIDNLKVWDKPYLNLSKKLMKTRIRFIGEFEHYLHKAVEMISDSRETYKLLLKFVHKKEDVDFEGCVDEFQNRDIQSGFSNLGPQRNNLKFEINGKDVIDFGSQGQKRTLVLALRIAQFYYLKSKTGISPLLLIDDVIRELDSKRRSAFINLLKDCGQAIFTTPDLDGLDEITKGPNTKIYIVDKPGKVQLSTDF